MYIYYYYYKLGQKKDVSTQKKINFKFSIDIHKYSGVFANIYIMFYFIVVGNAFQNEQIFPFNTQNQYHYHNITTNKKL